MKSKESKVLAIGAAGSFAGHIPAALRKRGIRVRALVRSQTEAEAVRTQGNDDVAIGDLRDVASLDAAMRGVNGVFHIGPAFVEDEAQLGLNVIEAAQRAGVRRFVFSSVIQPTITRLSNHANKIPVEDALYASGLEYVVLQPANFFQNIGKAWPGVVAQGVFNEPFPKSVRVAHVDLRDVAEVVSIAFADDRLTYGTFELCAGLLNRIEIATTMSQILGRNIEAGEPSFFEWETASKVNFTSERREAMKKIFAYYSHSPMGGNSLVLKAILEREPIGIRDYIESLAAQ
jgi:uncharacterized protein YbjT (DUF2867 family)